jgi:hypothetical protein
MPSDTEEFANSAASADAEIFDLCRLIDAAAADRDMLTAGRYQLTELLQGAGQSATLDALRAAAKIATIPTKWCIRQVDANFPSVGRS